MVIGLLLAFAAPTSRWLDRNLAGLTFSYKSKGDVFWQDSKSGFFLTREIECDGGIVTLELTRDHRDVRYATNGIDAQQGHRPLPRTFKRLGTGKGVTIGDTPQAVVKRLGRPSRVSKSGSHQQFLDYSYSGMGRDLKGMKADYDETYTFKAGKLIQIVFLQDEESLLASGSASFARVNSRG